ncbi:MAG: alkaline phosphatase [Pirellulaceae bacterium]
MSRRALLFLLSVVVSTVSTMAQSPDHVRDLQLRAMETKTASWGHWGTDPGKYSDWTNHSNRLIPVYTFGISLDSLSGEHSVYRDAAKLKSLYGELPEGTLQVDASYFDQTDIHHLQMRAVEAGKKNIILFVFDGMDWQTTWAAATYQRHSVVYHEGHGTGLRFLDYDNAKTDFGFCVTSAHHDKATFDVDAQIVLDGQKGDAGGYDPQRGGSTPWEAAKSREYLIGKDRSRPHLVTDSASSATSMTTGLKTYNAAINVSVDGEKLEPIARRLQREQGFSVGIVTSVPISHATPAAAYANNVTRNDYQDLTRDLLGLSSASHREPLPGADVVIGAGWGVASDADKNQGRNFAAGNLYVDLEDLRRVDVLNGGRYVVAQRTAGVDGTRALNDAASRAAKTGSRLLGFYGTDQAHLPFRTADGRFDPAKDVKGTEAYTPADIHENPTLADMTEAALSVLGENEKGFWLMVEPGDVDWANHANNIDNSIGAVLSGDEAFAATTAWIEENDAWDETVVIVTADHGHHFVLLEPEAIAGLAIETDGAEEESNDGSQE